MINIEERAKTNSTGELIKTLMLALAEVKLTPEELIIAEEDSQKMKNDFIKIFSRYKQKL